MKKYIIILLSLPLFGLAQEGLKENFYKIALNAEFGGTNDGKIKKWKKDINVFIKNPEHSVLLDEFNKIKDEINTLSSSTKINRVFDESNANFVVFFSDRFEYAKYDSSLSNYLSDNWGLFWLYWNRNNEIYKGSMYVDIERTKDLVCQKHILREELTQALGLMNDINNNQTNSIFHQEWNCTNYFTKMDKNIISLFLSQRVFSGMNKKDLDNLF